jgi:hypothetical protein
MTENAAAADASDGGLSAGLLDSQFLTSEEELRTLPIVRVLTGVFFNELVAWTVTLFATLLIPQFVTADSLFATPCLLLMVLGLMTLVVCFCVMVECRHRGVGKQSVVQFMVVLHVAIALICVTSAILIHALATLCFVLMVWSGALVMLLKLNQTPTRMESPQQLVLLSVYSSILVCFVCVAQELTLKDFAVNAVAFVLNGLFTAFRYDWLAIHADPSDTTYSIRESDRAWFDLYTWTADQRIRERCHPTKPTPLSHLRSGSPYDNEPL